MNMLYGFWHGMIVHLWQTTLILALLLVIERVLRGAPSRVSHTLWGIGLLKIFLPLSFFGGAADALYRAAGGGPQGVDRAGALALQPIVTVLYPIASGGTPVLGSALSYAIVAATAVWAAFFLYFIARLIIDAVRVRRQSGIPLAALEPALAGRLGGALDGAGIPRECVLVSGAFVMPTVGGLVRPRIVVPEDLVRDLPEEQLRAILLHEDAHRRRRDPLRTAAGRLGLAIFFFYPLIYPVLHRLKS
ncbi:MAG: M56 family metallopeptidase, partial [Candidatus Krumholzibacteria bacterium]|nr:M56 family metallopeptidase [Candidatus Krumholzibacteria bacterium]